ncbi:MAG: LysM peptidoglycan-binding domain-containing protein [Verrucomicrobiales bacterium]|nr:LysM peptidoglycan-binding domain-containing protein [Verrucomicrobiae bacterium]
MKNAVIAIAVSLMSLGSMSCSQLLTKTPSTQAYDYAANGQTAPAAQGQQQGAYYGNGYDQAQVYPQPGNTYQAPTQPAYPDYQTPTYQAPAPTYQQQAYTPPPPAYTPPAYTGSSASGQTYTVQKGDNLYRISQMHGTSVQNLMSTNGLSSDVIYPGDVLTIR